MSVSSSAARQVLTASQHIVARKTSCAAIIRRPMTSAAMSLSLEERTPIELPIFDIFDAPSRLGESSKMLAQAATSRVEPNVRQSVNRTASSSRPAVQPLPPPVMYDGPARPSSLGYGPRIRRIHSHATPSSEARGSASVLPSPEVFDGPSRLRPYLRNDTFDSSVSSFDLEMSISMCLLWDSHLTLLF